MTDMSLEWNEPPKNGSGRPTNFNYEAIASMLEANPGRWARITNVETRNDASAMHIAITRGKNAFAPEGAFSAVTRTVGKKDDGTKIVHIWAKKNVDETDDEPTP